MSAPRTGKKCYSEAYEESGGGSLAIQERKAVHVRKGITGRSNLGCINSRKNTDFEGGNIQETCNDSGVFSAKPACYTKTRQGKEKA